MNHDIELLRFYLRVSLWAASIFATLFVAMYLFSRWYASPIGRVMMLQGVTLAVALDITLLFQYWMPKDIFVLFWVQLSIFSLVALSSASLCVLLWRLNYKRRY